MYGQHATVVKAEADSQEGALERANEDRMLEINLREEEKKERRRRGEERRGEERMMKKKNESLRGKKRNHESRWKNMEEKTQL